jgi:two-component system response regulator HydG
MSQKLLLVDDEKDILDSLKRVLSTFEDLEIYTASNGQEALEKCRQYHPDVVITDLRMPGMEGLELLTRIKELNENIQAVMITGHGTIDDAVQAMRAGAYDFIQKPFKKQQILAVTKRVLEKASLLDENRKLREKLRKRSSAHYEWGSSELFRSLLQRTAQAAQSDATILIMGESGTGKEVLGNYIYDHSSRSERPFIKVNCAAIPENLIESELFGHKKGSFTGAVADRKGKFQEADGGTLFLDEIGELPLPMQSKLLRVLQEGEVNPVGGKVEKVNVRIVAATNRNLKEQVEAKAFREDLYYRLNVISINIPSLKMHPEDIPRLAAHFVSKYCKKNSRDYLSINKKALEILEAYSWPGNIRELENTIERAVIFAIGTQITEQELPDDIKSFKSTSVNFNFRTGYTLDEIETEAIRMALKRHQGNKKFAADELGVSLRTIYRKMDKILEEA